MLRVKAIFLLVSLSWIFLASITAQTERVCPPDFSTQYQTLCSLPSICDCDYFRGCSQCCFYNSTANQCAYTSSNHFSIESGSSVISCDIGYSILYGDSLSFTRSCADYCECDASTNQCEYCCRVTETSCYRREAAAFQGNVTFPNINSVEALPPLATNFSTVHLNPMIEQGACGASHVLSAASVFSERLSRLYGTQVAVSPQNFMCAGTSEFNSTIQMYPGCSGGVAYDVLDSLRSYPGQLTCTGSCKTGCLPYEAFYGGVVRVDAATQCRVGFSQDSSVVTEIECLAACNCSSLQGCDCCRRDERFCYADQFDYATACDTPPPDSPYRTSCTDTCTSSCSDPSFSSQERYRAINRTTCLIYNGNWPAAPNTDLESVVMCGIYTEGVMTVTMEVNDTFISFFESNPDRIFNSSSSSGEVIGVQSFVLVGWGVGAGDPGIKFWRLATNWGTNYGLNGYILVERGINLLNIESEICMIGAAADLPDPQQQISVESPGVPFFSRIRDFPETNQWFPLQTNSPDLLAAMSELYGSSITVDNDVSVLFSHGQLASGLLIYTNFSVGNFSYEGLVLRPAYNSSSYKVINAVPPVELLLSSSTLAFANLALLAGLFLLLSVLTF